MEITAASKLCKISRQTVSYQCTFVDKIIYPLYKRIQYNQTFV